MQNFFLRCHKQNSHEFPERRLRSPFTQPERYVGVKIQEIELWEFVPETFNECAANYSLENSHNSFAFNGHVAAIFIVRL